MYLQKVLSRFKVKCPQNDKNRMLCRDWLQLLLGKASFLVLFYWLLSLPLLQLHLSVTLDIN